MRSTWRTRLAVLYLFGVLGAYAVVVLAARNPPPFVDYPDWVYQGELLHRVLMGHPVAGYALKHYPVPNSTTSVGLGLLDTVLPWRWAAKVWVCLYLVLAGVATWTLSGALGRRTEWRLLVAMPGIVFVNLNFWYGHIGFEVGVCLVMLLLAMLVRGRSRAAVGAMLVVIFFTHMEACAGGLVMLAAWCARGREWRRMWAAAPAVGLTAWYAAGRFLSGNVDVRGVPAAYYRYGSEAFLIYKGNTLLKTFGYVSVVAADWSSVTERIFGRGVLMFLLAASVCLAVLCLVGVVRGREGADMRLRAPVLLFLGVSLLLPQVWLGVADPGSRLLLMGAAIGMFGVDWRRSYGTPIAVLSVMFCLVNLWQFARVDQDPRMRGRRWDLPGPALMYGRVQPELRLEYYDRLDDGRMDLRIFPTALFREEAGVEPGPGTGPETSSEGTTKEPTP